MPLPMCWECAAKLQQVQMLPVFIGIGLGVLLGSIPVFVP